mmetsp:Transcript_181469/g.576060  ORF Transcript_181469/g.576060 Transcript_181469/m.576060 type:complete len:289 (-) Transcript_181469:382-1248(-)
MPVRAPEASPLLPQSSPHAEQQMSDVRLVTGAGQFEWVWTAIASGHHNAVRAAPSNFDISGVHPRYGSVLTAFLQGLLNLEGAFVTEGDRRSRAKELVSELGRRGARPDQVIPCANILVKGLQRNWRLAGDITAMQAVIQIRNDLLSSKFEDMDNDGEDSTLEDSVKTMSDLIDRYSEMISTGGHAVPRASIPEAVVNIWERFLEDGASSGDVEIVAPDGAPESKLASGHPQGTCSRPLGTAVGGLACAGRYALFRDARRCEEGGSCRRFPPCRGALPLSALHRLHAE